MKDEKKIMLSEEQKLQLINEYHELCRYCKYSAIQRDLALSCIRAIEAGQKPKFSVKYIKDYVKKQQQHQIKTQNCEDSSRTYKETKAKLTAKEKQAKQDKKTLRKEQQLQAYRIRGEQEYKKGCYIASDMAHQGCNATLDNKQPPYSMFDITKESIKEEQCQIKTQGRKDLSCTYEEAKAEQIAKEKQAKKDEKTLQNERQLHAYHILTEQEYKKGCEKAHHMAHQSWQATLNNQNPPYSTFDIVKEGIKEELRCKHGRAGHGNMPARLRVHDDYYVDNSCVPGKKSKSQPQRRTSNDDVNQTIISYITTAQERGKVGRNNFIPNDMNIINNIAGQKVIRNDMGNDNIYCFLAGGNGYVGRELSKSEPKNRPTTGTAFNRQCNNLVNRRNNQPHGGRQPRF